MKAEEHNFADLLIWYAVAASAWIGVGYFATTILFPESSAAYLLAGLLIAGLSRFARALMLSNPLQILGSSIIALIAGAIIVYRAGELQSMLVLLVGGLVGLIANALTLAGYRATRASGRELLTAVFRPANRMDDVLHGKTVVVLTIGYIALFLMPWWHYFTTRGFIPSQSPLRDWLNIMRILTTTDFPLAVKWQLLLVAPLILTPIFAFIIGLLGLLRSPKFNRNLIFFLAAYSLGSLYLYFTSYALSDKYAAIDPLPSSCAIAAWFAILLCSATTQRKLSMWFQTICCFLIMIFVMESIEGYWSDVIYNILRT